MRLRTILAAGLLGCLAGSTLARAEDSPDPGEDVKRAEILTLESLRTQLRQTGNLAYSEVTRTGTLERRFDWVVSSFPEGNWSYLAQMPGPDGTVRGRLSIRRGTQLLRGVVKPDLSWNAKLDEYDAKYVYRNSPTASWWFPVDSLRVDERLSQWDAIDARMRDGRFEVTFPANTVVVEALNDPEATIEGLFAHQLVFGRVGERYVLTEAHILSALLTRDGQEVPSIDAWRGEIAGYKVCRSHSRVWSDFRFVGSYLLPMKWEFRHPMGVAKGGVIPGSIVQLTPDDVDQRLVLRVPDHWTGPGALRDGRTGEILFSRSASRGLTEAESRPAPQGYAPRPKPQSTSSGSRAPVVLVGIGIAIALFAVFLYSRGKSRPGG